MTMSRASGQVFLSAVLILSSGLEVCAQIGFQVLEPVASPSQASLGNGVDVFGDLLVSGNQRTFDPLHIFRLNRSTGEWEVEAAITPPMGVSTPGTERAGLSRQVAVGANRVVIGQEIGTSSNKDEVVQVYLYSDLLSTWVLEQLLAPAFPDDPAFFGSSVALAGNWIAVGAVTEGVWLFNYDDPTWVQEQVIPAPSGSQQFAADVVMDGNVLVVSDSLSADTAYIYERTAGVWSHVRTISLSVAPSTAAVGLDGGTLAIGDLAGGTVTVLERAGSTWANPPSAQILEPYDYDVGLPGLSGVSVGPLFGASLDISGDLLAVGSPINTGAVRGHIFLWERSGGEWTQVQKMYGPPGANGGFALEVAIDGEWIATAGTEFVQFVNEGRVWALDVSSRPEWSDFGFGLAGVTGEPELRGYGNMHGPMIYASHPDDLRFNLTNAAPSAFAIVWFNTTASFLPFKQGVLVPTPVNPLSLMLMTNPSGEIGLGSEWTLGVSPGFELYYQFWIADSAAPAGASASNALKSTAP